MFQQASTQWRARTLPARPARRYVTSTSRALAGSPTCLTRTTVLLSRRRTGGIRAIEARVVKAGRHYVLGRRAGRDAGYQAAYQQARERGVAVRKMQPR